ncbi:MAG: hypothetical protein QNL04_05555 [SAR324 cluster bacterium]|nr:hypothetical protein [SAR324 cluster bacterium]
MENKYYVFLMDPFESLNFETETSLLLIEQLQLQGRKSLWVEPKDLVLSHNQLHIYGQEVVSVHPFSLGEKKLYTPESFAAFINRKDPPFDLHFLQMTLLLDFLPASLLQVNPPQALQKFNEKLFGLLWPELTPPSITSQDFGHLSRFILEHGSVIIKPLDECSGRGIVKIQTKDKNWEETLKEILSLGNQPKWLTLQAFLEDVAQGDKRIYLADGEPIGWVNRVPKEGSYLANIHQGALCEATELSARDLEIIEAIKPTLQREKILFVGLDVIGGFITEINITSPSAIRQINEVMGKKCEIEMVDLIIQKAEAPQSPLT